MQPSSPQIQLPEDSLPDVPTEDDTDDTNPIDDPVDLDKFAPSNIYDSWAPSVADWGFPVEETAVTNDADPQADHDTFAPKEDYSWGDPPSEPEDNGTKSKKTVSSVDTARSDSRSGGFDNKSSVKAKGKGKGRGKGKGKENPPSQTNTISQSENSEYTFVGLVFLLSLSIWDHRKWVWLRIIEEQASNDASPFHHFSQHRLHCCFFCLNLCSFYPAH